jgi:hypothetical protein
MDPDPEHCYKLPPLILFDEKAKRMEEKHTLYVVFVLPFKSGWFML